MRNAIASRRPALLILRARSPTAWGVGAQNRDSRRQRHRERMRERERERERQRKGKKDDKREADRDRVGVKKSEGAGGNV